MSSGKRRQIGEAGIAGAEIVDRDAYARLAQPRQPLGDRRLVDQQRAFGDFDRHPRRIHARGGNFVEQPLVIAVARHVLGQQVDRQLEPLSGPSHTAALRSALRWTSRDSRSPRPAAAARLNSAVADGAMAERASASAPTIRPLQRLDQRLKQHLDLLVRDQRFRASGHASE